MLPGPLSYDMPSSAPYDGLLAGTSLYPPLCTNPVPPVPPLYQSRPTRYEGYGAFSPAAAWLNNRRCPHQPSPTRIPDLDPEPAPRTRTSHPRPEPVPRARASNPRPVARAALAPFALLAGKTAYAG